jgi:hypothetical protein
MDILVQLIAQALKHAPYVIGFTRASLAIIVRQGKAGCSSK